MTTANGVNGAPNGQRKYSPVVEACRIFNLLTDKSGLRLPPTLIRRENVSFNSDLDDVYFPIPLKETETAAALKAIEASLISEIADLRYGGDHQRVININLDKVACFMLSGYLATVNGLGKLDPQVKKIIKSAISSLANALSRNQ